MKFPWKSINQLSKQLKGCPLEVQGGSPADSSSYFLCLVREVIVFLDAQEALGEWEDVFLERNPDWSHSLTSRTAYWASGFELGERGEPTEPPVTSSLR